MCRNRPSSPRQFLDPVLAQLAVIRQVTMELAADDQNAVLFSELGLFVLRFKDDALRPSMVTINGIMVMIGGWVRRRKFPFVQTPPCGLCLALLLPCTDS
jgi:hypothetical protein